MSPNSTMLKFFFVCLLAGNGLLFAYHQGYLEAWLPSGREPARATNQLNADKIKLLPQVPAKPAALAAPAAAASVVAVSTAAASAPAVSSPGSTTLAAELAAVKKPVLTACTEIGNFNVADAKRFEAQLTALSLGDKLSRRDIKEQSSHMVWIPPQGGKEGADKKAGELRNFGVSDFYVIQESSPQRWGISLGVFKTEEAARAYLATLSQKGVRSARLTEHKMAVTKTAFQLRQFDAGAKDILDRVKAAGFPTQETRDCTPDSA
jgi:hypothetical protein